jgi:hypothetical protein
MTRKIYKSAMGKPVDMGSLLLQNEQVRAVGNMNVNARGDKLGNDNQVVETKPQQIQRQITKTTNVSSAAPTASAHKARRAKKEQAEQSQEAPDNTTVDTAPVDNTPVQDEPPVIVTAPPAQDNIVLPGGGLAAAIARQREVKQELDKTRRQTLQSQGVRKI